MTMVTVTMMMMMAVGTVLRYNHINHLKKLLRLI